jgi:hypothetical protein
MLSSNIKDEEIARVKGYEAESSLPKCWEKHLNNIAKLEFNKLRATAFQRAYFEKDNDSKSGSKGDFIYRGD